MATPARQVTLHGPWIARDQENGLLLWNNLGERGAPQRQPDFSMTAEDADEVWRFLAATRIRSKVK